jgi:cytochrome c-type biogenesis protein CcmF
VLTSVHAFATDPRRGIFILIFLSLVVGSSLALYAWRAPKNTLGGKFSLSSRETFILLGNVFLVVSAGSVLLGTLYPLLIDALHLGKISVGPPYFNSVFVPIMIPLLVLMGVGPWANWKNTNLKTVIQRLWGAALVALVAGIAIPLIMGQFTWLAGLGFLLAFWIIASGCLQIIRQIKMGKPTRSFIGMQLAHLGIAVFVIGITMVGAYQEEKDVRMLAGDTVNVGGYQIQLEGVELVPGPNYEAMRGTFVLTKNGSPQGTLYPEKRNYFSSTMPMTEAAIDAGLTRDVYVSLGEELSDKAWAVRVYYKPFVDWIWGGCLLMALGGVLAISDKRYRIKLKRVAS